jgi:hypothetical protein
MDTTVVAATAIGAMAGLIGGLGGPVITASIQRSNERSRQRERAAEVLGSAGLLLAELNPGSMLMPIYLAPVLQSSEQEAIDEALAKLAKLDQRVSVVRENLSTLAGWWSTATGSDLAEQLQAAIFEIRRLDGLLIEDLRVHDVTGPSRASVQGLEGRELTGEPAPCRDPWGRRATAAEAPAVTAAEAPASSASRVMDGLSVNGMGMAPTLAFRLKGAGYPSKASSLRSCLRHP